MVRLMVDALEMGVKPLLLYSALAQPPAPPIDDNQPEKDYLQARKLPIFNLSHFAGLTDALNASKPALPSNITTGLLDTIFENYTNLKSKIGSSGTFSVLVKLTPTGMFSLISGTRFVTVGKSNSPTSAPHNESRKARLAREAAEGATTAVTTVPGHMLDDFTYLRPPESFPVDVHSTLQQLSSEMAVLMDDFATSSTRRIYKFIEMIQDCMLQFSTVFVQKLKKLGFNRATPLVVVLQELSDDKCRRESSEHCIDLFTDSHYRTQDVNNLTCGGDAWSHIAQQFADLDGLTSGHRAIGAVYMFEINPSNALLVELQKFTKLVRTARDVAPLNHAALQPEVVDTIFLHLVKSRKFQDPANQINIDQFFAVKNRRLQDLLDHLMKSSQANKFQGEPVDDTPVDGATFFGKGNGKNAPPSSGRGTGGKSDAPGKGGHGGRGADGKGAATGKSGRGDDSAGTTGGRNSKKGGNNESGASGKGQPPTGGRTGKGSGKGNYQSGYGGNTRGTSSGNGGGGGGGGNVPDHQKQEHLWESYDTHLTRFYDTCERLDLLPSTYLVPAKATSTYRNSPGEHSTDAWKLKQMVRLSTSKGPANCRLQNSSLFGPSSTHKTRTASSTWAHA
jgi:hypothetical protein